MTIKQKTQRIENYISGLQEYIGLFRSQNGGRDPQFTMRKLQLARRRRSILMVAQL